MFHFISDGKELRQPVPDRTEARLTAQQLARTHRGKVIEVHDDQDPERHHDGVFVTTKNGSTMLLPR